MKTPDNDAKVSTIRAVLVILGVLIVIALGCYALDSGIWSAANSKQSFVISHMGSIYNGLREYRERTGRWPKELMEAATGHFSEGHTFICVMIRTVWHTQL